LSEGWSSSGSTVASQPSSHTAITGFCIYCGQDLQEDSEFCSRCGRNQK
jgi:predicted amidophosphoribosyltransferase